MTRILVVEDNAPSRELLCDWLEGENYEVVSAADLKQAFAAIHETPPDAILLDVQLGDGQDGLSIAWWIRKQLTLSHIPVIAVTAHAMVTEHARIFLAGCNACVSKPVDFGLLRHQLDQWLVSAHASVPSQV
jgi:CheY-like chemotaxis protein